MSMFPFPSDAFDNFRRALDEAAAGGVLMQEVVDREIRNLVDYQNPLRLLLPRKPGQGEQYILIKRTAGTTSAAFVNDTETFTESTGTPARSTFNYRTLGVQIKISRRLQASGVSFIDAAQFELENKIEDFRDYEEWAIIKGNATTDTKAFNGLDVLLTTTVGTTSDAGGKSISTRLMDKAFHNSSSGNIGLIVCSRRMQRDLNALEIGRRRFIDVIEVGAGFRVTTYDGVPIAPSTRVVDVQTFDGSSVTSETGSNTTSIYFLDTKEVFIAELEPLQSLALARASAQFTAMDIFSTETVVVGNPETSPALIGVAPAAVDS